MKSLERLPSGLFEANISSITYWFQDQVINLFWNIMTASDHGSGDADRL